MKKKKTIYIILIIIVGVILAALIYTGVRFLITPALHPGEFETTQVDRGPVILSTPAKGTVVPGNEVVILSPATSVLIQVLKPAGSRVKSGEIILMLDPKSIEDEIEKLKDQLEVKRNNLRRNRLNARSITVDLDYNIEVKKLRIASLKSELADQEQLLEVGGISPAQYEKTKQELTLAEKDLEMILEKNSIRLQQLEAEEEGLLLEIRIQEKNLEEKQETLKKMNVRAPSDGIVLAVYGNEGEKINADQLLVRMSDLTSFKINGSMDEKFADLVKTGGAVYAVIDEEKLSGRIGNIKPLIENNMLQFDVFLERNSHEKLIPNQNIEIQIVQNQKDSVLRTKIEPIFGRGDRHEVFVLEPGKAVRREIITGLKGLEYVEIISGLEEGEELIISDIPSFRRIRDIEIR
jgi:HlyD family secretion protein